MVDVKLRQTKEEKQLRNDFENRKLDLIALPGAKVLENYNRIENIKILDLPESHQNRQRESYQQTTAAVMNLAKTKRTGLDRKQHFICTPASCFK